MTQSPFAIPLRPAYEEAETAKFRAFWRALTAFALAQLSRDDPVDVVRRIWERDKGAHLITRPVVNPASTTGWGTETLSTVIGPFCYGIAMRSAAAQLFAEALRLQLAGDSTQAADLVRFWVVALGANGVHLTAVFRAPLANC